MNSKSLTYLNIEFKEGGLDIVYVEGRKLNQDAKENRPKLGL